MKVVIGILIFIAIAWFLYRQISSLVREVIARVKKGKSSDAPKVNDDSAAETSSEKEVH